MAKVSDINKYLFLKQLTGKITQEEKSELKEWRDLTPRQRSLYDTILDTSELTREYRQRSLVDTDAACREMETRIALAEAPRRRRRRMMACAAAIALLLLGGLIWNYTRHITPGTQSDGISPTSADSIYACDTPIKPGVTKAFLRNPAGQSITLGATDTLVDSRNLLSQLPTDSHAASEKLCLEVPRGGEFKIILEDSTIVWLNSESTLRYPQTFGSAERRVQVSGEAYFAVAKDPSRPFYVETSGQVIQVYGTTFNVRDYPDDNNTYTTLESGSITLRKLSGKNSGELFLSPGHQAIFDKDNATITMTTVTPHIITGWRHGRFVFEGQTLRNIMRDLARWYNFDFEFTDKSVADIVFSGSIPRYSDFKTAITILENCGDIAFDISADRVTVSLM